MRVSFNIIAAAALLLSSTALAAYEHNLDSIIARHDLDDLLEVRGEMTEFEVRAELVRRAPANGDCTKGHPEVQIYPSVCAHHQGGDSRSMESVTAEGKCS